jgi:hypothetical protein
MYVGMQIKDTIGDKVDKCWQELIILLCTVDKKYGERYHWSPFEKNAHELDGLKTRAQCDQ